MSDRKPTEDDGMQPPDGTNDQRIRSGRIGRFGRRGLLKAAGVTALGGLLASTAAGASSDDYDAALVVDGRETAESTSYAFTVDGTVSRVERTDNTDDSVSDGHVEGRVGDGANAYWFTGAVTSLESAGPASLEFGTDAESILPEPEHELIVRSETAVDYEFTTTGPVRKLLDNGRDSAESGNDSVVENDDGTYTVSGYTGNGYGDGYAIRGEVTEFSPVFGDVELVYDGQSVSVAELTGTEPARELVVRSEAAVDYEFTTTGPVRKLRDNGRDSAESGNDSVVENDDGTYTVSGYTGNGYGDGYAIRGDVTEFSPMEGQYTIRLDGTSVTAYELTGTEPPEPSDPSESDESVIGGGDGFAGIVTADDADYTVTSRSGLRDALSRATRGDVVFVPGDAHIEANRETFWIPAGVTLASDRGHDGSPGGVISESSNTNERLLKTDGDDVTIAGLRIRGPHHGEYNGTKTGSWENAHIGIQMLGRNGEVANCQVSGWGYDAIRCRGNTHIHHNDIRHNTLAGLGYGIQVFSNDETLVEYNRFGRNRHCIVGQGDASYTARYNVCEADQRHHAFDHHSSGGRIEIYNNRFEMTPDSVDVYPSAFRQRDCAEHVEIHHNWSLNPNGPNYDDPGDGDATFANASRCGFRNTDVHDNHYGEGPAPDGVGCP